MDSFLTFVRNHSELFFDMLSRSPYQVLAVLFKKFCSKITNGGDFDLLSGLWELAVPNGTKPAHRNGHQLRANECILAQTRGVEQKARLDELGDEVLVLLVQLDKDPSELLKNLLIGVLLDLTCDQIELALLVIQETVKNLTEGLVRSLDDLIDFESGVLLGLEHPLLVSLNHVREVLKEISQRLVRIRLEPSESPELWIGGSCELPRTQLGCWQRHRHKFGSALSHGSHRSLLLPRFSSTNR